MSRNCRKLIFFGGVGVLLGLALSTQAFSQACVCATDTSQVKIQYVPIKFIPAGDGARMYAQYCAACHGESGQGNGPAAQSLGAPPADLTMLTFANKGHFPDSRLNKTLSNPVVWAAHEKAGMPYWYLAFRSLDMQASSNADIRINSLVTYLHKLQAPGLTVSNK